MCIDLPRSRDADRPLSASAEILAGLNVHVSSNTPSKPPPGFDTRDDAALDAEPAAPAPGQTGGFGGSTSTFALGSTGGTSTGTTAKVSLRPLPKRQLWIVKVPKPPEDHGATEAAGEPSTTTTTQSIAALEAEIAALDARVRTANQARDVARTHLAKARERARETSAAIKAASAACEPLYARVNELNAMERKVRDAKRAVGFDSEAAVEAALAEAESRMNHESLSVLEQKRLLREMSKLRAKRPEAAALESTIRTLKNAKEERARLGAELKASRDALELLREKRAMSLKIVDHYAGCVDAAVDDSAEAYAAKTARVTEVKRLRKEGYEARKARRETAQSREREEWLLARRTFREARDLVANGHFAEAEAACLRQMEHVHARLNTDREYRAKYLEGLRRDRETREAAAKAAIEADAEATAKALAEAKAAALEAKREKERAEASREKEEKERARAEKEELRRRAKEERAAADAALAEDVRRRAELARRRTLEADSEGRRMRPQPPPAPVLGPSKIAAALARAVDQSKEQAPPAGPNGGASLSPQNPRADPLKPATTDAERRVKNAEKKRRRRERAVAEKEAERLRLEAHERRDKAKSEERALRRRGPGGGPGGGGGGWEGDGSGRREGFLAATTSKAELPAGMRAMTSRHRARAHAASWCATVAAGASLVSLAAAAVVVLSLSWSPARELTYE